MIDDDDIRIEREIMPDQQPATYEGIWVGRDKPGTLVQVSLERPGDRIRVTPDAAEHMAQLLLLNARLAREQLLRNLQAQSN